MPSVFRVAFAPPSDDAQLNRRLLFTSAGRGSEMKELAVLLSGTILMSLLTFSHASTVSVESLIAWCRATSWAQTSKNP
jgi:hypothetical protein